MKNLIIGIVLGCLIIPLGVMSQDHLGRKMSSDKDVVKQYEVSADFQKQLNIAYKASLELNKAFVAGDLVTISSKATEMSRKMKNVDMSLLKGTAHMDWMTYLKPINEGLKAIVSAEQLTVQRKLYAGVSEGLYKSVKAFGVGETVYHQYCPMVKASWLNDSKDIKNPYYGSMMLTCGSTKEVLN